MVPERKRKDNQGNPQPAYKKRRENNTEIRETRRHTNTRSGTSTAYTGNEEEGRTHIAPDQQNLERRSEKRRRERGEATQDKSPSGKKKQRTGYVTDTHTYRETRRDHDEHRRDENAMGPQLTSREDPPMGDPRRDERGVREPKDMEVSREEDREDINKKRKSNNTKDPTKKKRQRRSDDAPQVDPEDENTNMRDA